MKLSDFDFDLPEELIALRPAQPRISSRLLVAQNTGISNHSFGDLSKFLRPGDRLVLNDTKVIPARLQGTRRRASAQGDTFARIQVTLLSCNDMEQWQALAKPAKRIKAGEQIDFENGLSAEVLNKSNDGLRLAFNRRGREFDQALAEIGQMPLPPYIAAKRAPDARDMVDYQTIFAKNRGAVAAPTASLHFDAAMFDQLQANGIALSYVTLHVGAGTFLPVKTDDISEHKMHAEWGEVSAKAVAEINSTKAAGGRIVPVGTTALRLIESAAAKTGHISSWSGETDIFIKPGFDFRITDALVTNFHLPKSTLLMLVSALIGRDYALEIYQHAIKNKFRFFSYGDASLLFPPGKQV